MQHNHERVGFGSKIGAILAAAGSAVGLGNIWRFPFETGNHGGAAFILIYLGCVFIFGLPIMIAEFTIGRRSKASTGGAYQALAPGTKWKWVGYLGVLTGFLILGYYSVVAGWTLEYVWQAATGGFAGKSSTEFITVFQEFSQDPLRPLLWLFIFMLLTHRERGGERYRTLFESDDAYSVHTRCIACHLLGNIAGSREGCGIPVETRFQQGDSRCLSGSNGAGILLIKSWNGMFVYLRILLWKRHPSGPDSDECRAD